MKIQNVVKLLTPFFKEHGYKRKSSWFYKIQNDVIYCIHLERPGGLYVGCYLFPLYVPLEFRSLSFGGRFCYYRNTPYEVPILDLWMYDEDGHLTEEGIKYAKLADSPPPTIDEFVEKTFMCCKEHIFPLYERISTPEGTLDFLKEGFQFIHQTYFTDFDVINYYEWYIYTCFVLSRFNEVPDIVKKLFTEYDQDPNMTLKAKQRFKDRINALVDMFDAPEEERIAFIKKTVEESQKICGLY